jgi:hypothetical protein
MDEQKPLNPSQPGANSADQDAPITEPGNQPGSRTGPGADTTPL